MDAASPSAPRTPESEGAVSPGATSPRQDTWSKLISLTAELALAAIPRQGQLLAAEHGLVSSVPRAEIEEEAGIAEQLFLRLEESIYGPISTHQTLALIAGARLSGYEAASTDLQHWSPIAYHPRFIAATHGDLRLVHRLLDGMTDLPAVATVPTGNKTEADTRPTAEKEQRLELAKVLRFPSGLSTSRRASSLERFGPESNEDPNANIVPPANPERNLRPQGRHTAVLTSPFGQSDAANLHPAIEPREDGTLFPTSSDRPFDVADEVPVHALHASPTEDPPAASVPAPSPQPAPRSQAAPAAPNLDAAPPADDDFSAFFEEALEGDPIETAHAAAHVGQPLEEARTATVAPSEPSVAPAAKAVPASLANAGETDVAEPGDPTVLIVKIMLGAAFFGIVLIIAILALKR